MLNWYCISISSSILNCFSVTRYLGEIMKVYFENSKQAYIPSLIEELPCILIRRNIAFINFFIAYMFIKRIFKFLPTKYFISSSCTMCVCIRFVIYGMCVSLLLAICSSLVLFEIASYRIVPYNVNWLPAVDRNYIS